MKLPSTTSSVLAGVANFVAILMVVGIVAQGFLDKAEQAPLSIKSVEPELVVAISLPTTTSDYTHRDLRAKGGKGSSEIGCVPLYPTPAPTKGKGSGGGRVPPPLPFPLVGAGVG